jgi:cold shock protein
MEKRKERGMVKWFDEAKGYGFITPDSGHKDIFFHRSNIDMLERTVDKGERVEFELGEGRQGPEARSVRALQEEG